MTYLTPVYAGDTQETLGGDDQPLGTVITEFRGASSLQSSQDTVTEISQAIALSNGKRRTITIRNTDAANSIFLGGENVTTAIGFELLLESSITLEVAGEIWAVCAAGLTAVVHMLAEVDA